MGDFTYRRALIALAVLFVLLVGTTALADEKGDAGDTEEFTCYQCHSKDGVTPWIATTWAESAHARTGVVCSKCHGNHDSGFDSEKFIPKPGPDVCEECHPLRVRQAKAGPHAAVKCTSCHPRHSFSLNVARNPDICVTCHTGDEHVDGYERSKMGVIYKTEGPDAAATCQTCHMPEGTHDVSKTLDDPPLMLKVCNKCHSASFAGKVLSGGEFIKHW